MDHVVFGRGAHTATFRSKSLNPSEDPYAGGSFVAELRTEGLRVERKVFVFRFDWGNLGAFFTDLAESWRGWDGERSWESPEHDLMIIATADHAGHCNIEFTVRDGPIHTWKATIGGFVIDGGEDMAAVARSIRAWIDG